jgi:multidrug resistance efflux pump
MARLTVPIVAFFRSFATRVRDLSRTQRLVFAVILLLIVLSGVSILRSSDDVPSEVGTPKRSVRLLPLGAMIEENAPLSLLGRVSSVSEATIRAEGSGRITIYRKLGDFVPAGGIIGEFENATERAQVLSAEGAYQAALAAREIAKISRGSAETSLDEARNGAINTLSAVYTTLDDVIRQKTDAIWKNPQERDAKLIPTISDFKLTIALEAERAELQSILTAREAKTASLSVSSELSAELTAAEAELRRVSKYLDDLSLALSRAIPDQNASQAQIDAWKAVVGGARLSINGSLTAVSASRSALAGATAAAEIAEKNAGKTENVAAVEAQVTSALGGLRAAQARLEKTIVRSPISGTIISLSAKTGDFLSPFTEVAVVSNNNALEVVAYLSEKDARTVAVGTKVDIEGKASGVVTKVPVALDPKTRRIEIKIGITDGAKNLVNGESVRILVARMAAPAVGSSKELFVPISAVKITPSGNFLFTVTASSTLSAIPVDIGMMRGETLEIKTDIPRDTRVVTDARGLKDGQAVEVVE